MKIRIDRKICIACGACGAIADEVYEVFPGHKSLFSNKNIKEFLVYDLDYNLKYIVKFDKKYLVFENDKLIKDFDKIESLSDFLGEDVIVEVNLGNSLEEDAIMGEQACPVNAINVEK